MDYKILIDASHGGEDIGYSSSFYKAKEANLELALILSKRLSDFKIANQLIRESDETLSYKQRTDNIKELIKGDKKYVLIVIDSGNIDNMVYYSLGDDSNFAQMLAKEINGHIIQKRLPLNPIQDYHYIRGIDKVLTLLVNLKLEDRESVNSKLKELGEGIVKAITTFLNIEYSKEVKEGEYKVEKGDTLWTIKKKFNITIEDLKELNNMKDNTVKVGSIIKISDVNEEEEDMKVTALKEEVKNKETLHRVAEGETLYMIANKYNVTTQDIRSPNNLLEEEVSPGVLLLIINN